MVFQMSEKLREKKIEQDVILLTIIRRQHRIRIKNNKPNS